MIEHPSKTSDRLWDLAMKAAVPLSILLSGVLIKHEVEISKIQSNRFTATNGLELERRITEAIAERYPPKWLREDLSSLTRAVEMLVSRVGSLESQIKVLETKVNNK